MAMSADLTASSAWWRGLNAAMATSTPPPEARPLVDEHLRWYPKADVALLSQAYAVAEHLHKEQKRKSGEPYITHPLAVATILAEMGLDTATLVAALLHDTVEDTPFSLAHLSAEFGPEVGVMVDGVTKVDQSLYGREAAAGETFRKMVIAAREDLRVLLIKLSDRLHNLRTLQFQPPHKRVKIAQGTRDLLIPLAERLGVYRLKRELEDLCFEYLEGEDFERTGTQSAQVRHQYTHEFDTFRMHLRDVLSGFRVKAEVKVRPRHPYSIYSASQRKPKGKLDPMDTVRFLVVVKGDEQNAYLALGAVHGRWKPLPAKFQDFIAAPRYNLYRALHTTVFTESGREVQIIICDIRAQVVSEYGIIAEIREETGKNGRLSMGRTTDPEWLTRLLGWQEQASAEELLRGARTELADTITVLSEKGQILTLPEGATPVDAAYALGAETGDHYSAATVSGRLISPSAPLRNGATVRIITTDSPAPDPAWLTSTKTGEARVGIRSWHRARDRERSETAGRGQLSDIIGLHRLIDLEAAGTMLGVARRAGHPTLECFYVAIGEGRVSPEDVADRVRG